MLYQSMMEFTGEFELIEGYSMPDDGIVINMESVMALNEIYELEYQIESINVVAAIQAKEAGVPITEGIGSAARKFADKIVTYWSRIKEWFVKLRKKLKQWFTGIVLRLADFVKDPTEYVEKYKGFITSADPEVFRADIKTYKYTNIYDFARLLPKVYANVLSEYERTLDIEFINGDRKDKRDTSSLAIGRKNIDKIKKDFCTQLDISEDKIDKEGISKYAFSYFRNGAKSNDDKIVPDKIDMVDEVHFVLNTKKTIKDVKDVGTSIDAVLGFIQDKVEDWSKNNSDTQTGMESVGSAMIAGVNEIQTLSNAFVSAYITALQERAATAFKICKKGAIQANKAGEGNTFYKRYVIGTPDERAHRRAANKPDVPTTFLVNSDGL